MKVIVCGGREYRDSVRVFTTLDKLLAQYPGLEIISGMAKGADTYAVNWADIRGVKVHRVYADWEKYKRAAGFIRNKRMLTDYGAEKVIAFPGGAGTANMIAIAKKAGLEVIEIQ